MLAHCDEATCKIDQTLYPRIGMGFLKISEGELLLFTNTGLLSPGENRIIKKIEADLSFLKDKPRMSHTLRERLKRHEKHTVAELVLSAIMGICIHPNQAWCWVEKSEIIAWIEENLARIYTESRIIRELNFLVGEGYLQFLKYKGVKYVTFTPKINGLINPGHFSSSQKAS